jgi:hypothetical protein
MGWIFYPLSRSALIQKLVRAQETEEGRVEIIDHEVCDNVLWSVVELTAKVEGVFKDLAPGQSRRIIRCDLLSPYGGEWGFKSMEEAMHPCYYSCPLRFLDMVPKACSAWRLLVHAWHANRQGGTASA